MDRTPNLLAFVGAGLAAFAVDISVLGLLTSLDMNPLTARLVGLAAATVIGWVINRTWTYGQRGAPTPAEFARYAGAGLTPTGVNFAVFAIVLMLWPQLHLVEALVIGAISGMAVSFAGYARLVFRQDP